MLKRTQRLKTKEVAFISHRGKRVENDYFFAKIWFDANLTGSKYAVNVSKKISKNATVRNKIKRRVKSAILLLENKKFASYVINVKKLDVLEMPFLELKEILDSLL